MSVWDQESVRPRVYDMSGIQVVLKITLPLSHTLPFSHVILILYFHPQFHSTYYKVSNNKLDGVGPVDNRPSTN